MNQLSIGDVAIIGTHGSTRPDKLASNHFALDGVGKGGSEF